MVEKLSDNKVTLKEQMKKFVIKGLLGFQTVNVYIMGRSLGIWDYLTQKVKNQVPAGGQELIVSFTLAELVDNLHLSRPHVDGWIHMGLVCGLFELEEGAAQCVKTAPYIFDFLINKESPFYYGTIMMMYSNIAPVSDLVLASFRTGKLISWSEIPEVMLKEGTEMSAFSGRRTEELFSRKFREFGRKLKQGGAILEVGCGFGVHFAYWAKKYKNCRFVGIDTDSRAVTCTQEIINQNQWAGRVEALNTTTADYLKANPMSFDLIILNEVLHEMNPDEHYRQQMFANLHALLTSGGLMIVTDSMISDTFAPTRERQTFEVMHKFLESAFGSRFYDEAGFQRLIASTPFANAELVREGSAYFWVLNK